MNLCLEKSLNNYLGANHELFQGSGGRHLGVDPEFYPLRERSEKEYFVDRECEVSSEVPEGDQTFCVNLSG